ncbi:MAG TPA: hypothetical protein VKB46_15775, partial [Pyrinomonadaceae bacterium]|nr:hypothetical protein [Pyrinomonadaceae bacterium]
TPRDASRDVTNLAHALNFRHPNFSLPDLPLPTPPPVVPCGDPDFITATKRTVVDDGEGWTGLMRSGLLDSWNLKLP